MSGPLWRLPERPATRPHWIALTEHVFVADEGTICQEGPEAWIYYPVGANTIPSGPYRTLMEAEQEAEAHHA